MFDEYYYLKIQNHFFNDFKFNKVHYFTCIINIKFLHEFKLILKVYLNID